MTIELLHADGCPSHECPLHATPDGLRGVPADRWVLDALARSAGERS